ncbi:ankyrin repeat-containing domain, PGG domain protein [Artemisia annua]|uniref:Ankyrin repeat-containing domain, PGG domain protein n=1 Tax=Artemisia annua TaxID=35608 RepID=A0A2U1NS00_ARTAN|nr:ankyrin repeat-containing domain, PGG domain protein [Artemisia annua]
MNDEYKYEYKDTERADTDLQIYKAALHNDWNDVCGLFEATPELKTKPVNDRLETPLMIAVGTNSSHEFVKQLLNNVKSYHDHDKWCGVNNSGNNALHYAAKVGNMIDAILMVQRLPGRMTRIKNIHGDTPLLLAAKLGRKDMIDEVFKKYTITLDDESVNLIIPAIQAGLLDFAMGIVCAIPEDMITPNALEALATKPEFFPSGNRLGFWGCLVYRCMPTIGIEIPKEHEQRDKLLQKLATRLEKLESAFKYVKTWAPAIKNIQDIKIKNELGNAIVKIFCKVIEIKDPVIASKVLGSSIAIAVKSGIYELIEECVLAYPGIIWSEFEGYNLFHLAIKERQVQVYNLVYQMSGHKAFAASELHGEEKLENALHVAAKLAPSHLLSTITGAALQLQRELQWYKEVETFVEPEHVKALNKDGKTPWMVFTDEHKDLLKEGQQWMKDTATSCTVVAALIVTITFAAAITVPGGNKEDGKPIFLNERAFMVFIISDAFALFSSSTSLLMFLGILTSRYAEIDFLYALPKRLTIGLMSLFLSIAATMIAFGATLALLLNDKVTWIAAPVVMITSIPVGLYALLQFPLLIEIVWSTYGPSIFRKQSSRVIY